MRTAVTLDPDVERMLRDVMRERSISFNEALNEAVRSGLSGKGLKSSRTFVQKSYPLGEGQEFRLEKALALADGIEDEELMRKLSLRK